MENSFKKIVTQSQKLSRVVNALDNSPSKKNVKALGLLTWSNNLSQAMLKSDSPTALETEKIKESLNNLLFVAISMADDFDIPLVSEYIEYLNETIAYVNNELDKGSGPIIKEGSHLKRANNLLDKVERSKGSPYLIPKLQKLYGSDLVFPNDDKNTGIRPYVVGNFVQGTFGGVSYADVPGKEGGYPISGGDSFDRLIMALLRFSDAVMVGASTLRTEPDHVWSAEFIAPELSELWKKQRQHLGKPEYWQPLQCFVTASGNINFDAQVFRQPNADVIIFTTASGEQRIRQSAKDGQVTESFYRIVTCDETPEGNVNLHDMMEKLALLDVKRLLVEGGANFYNSLERERLVDEIFLTVAPRSVGGSKEKPRPTLSMATGPGYTPEESPLLQLISLKTRNNFLYQRWKYRR